MEVQQVQNQNSLSAKFKINTDLWINEAVLGVLAAQKLVFLNPSNLDEGRWALVYSVDSLENICEGLGKIEEGSKYFEKLKVFKEKPEIVSIEKSIEKDAKIAQYRFKLILGSVLRHSGEIQFEGEL